MIRDNLSLNDFFLFYGGSILESIWGFRGVACEGFVKVGFDL
jgi:hypothetical protein